MAPIPKADPLCVCLHVYPDDASGRPLVEEWGGLAVVGVLGHLCWGAPGLWHQGGRRPDPVVEQAAAAAGMKVVPVLVVPGGKKAWVIFHTLVWHGASLTNEFGN